MKNTNNIIMLIALSIATSVFAQDSDKETTNTISNFRARQEQEEQRVMRVITAPITQQFVNVCTPEQMTRQRLRDIDNGKKSTTSQQSVNLNVGHEGMTINDNKGTVTNDVNVQVVNENENRCL
jgi:anion-transporting  ArsA/GET3 family ATPase